MDNYLLSVRNWDKKILIAGGEDMKIGLCYDTREAHGYNSVNINCCSYPSQKTINAIADLIVQNGFEVCLLGTPKDIFTSLYSRSFDLAFPILCSSYGRGQQVWMPSILELYNIPFIGSDAQSILLSSDKYQTGLAAEAYGVPVIPSLVLFESDGKKQTFDKVLSFPGIVKPNCGSDSKGVCLVQSKEEMWIRAEESWSIYKDKIIFQPYISGREITASIYENNGEPVIFGMSETVEKDGEPIKIYSYEYKHLQHCKKQYPKITASSYENIAGYAKIMFKKLECHDYARMDFRINEDGSPFLLEATLTPSLPLSASFFMGGVLYGVAPNKTIQHIIASAIQRYGL